MPTPPLSEDKMREALDALEAAGGNKTKAAASLGINRKTFHNRVTKAMAPDGIRDAASAVNIDLAHVGNGWTKTDAEGKVIGHSVFWKAPPVADDTLERIREAFEGLTPADPVPPPEAVMDDLCTVWPVMDIHYGMQARGTGGDDYDLDLASGDLRRSTEKLLAMMPFAARAVLILGGDTLHADDDTAQTPANRHHLDVAGRQNEVLAHAIDCLKFIASRLLSRSQNLTIKVLRGNHDENSHRVLAFAFKEHFRNDARVTVDMDFDNHLFMMQWGKTALFAHHGDKAPAERLSLYLADICPFWSDTRHRICLTGHIHHRQARDFGSIMWESLRAFCPPDAYAASMGYAARRAMQALVLDRQDGVVMRAFDPVER